MEKCSFVGTIITKVEKEARTGSGIYGKTITFAQKE
jgi:hypothetical protein